MYSIVPSPLSTSAPLLGPLTITIDERSRIPSTSESVAITLVVVTPPSATEAASLPATGTSLTGVTVTVNVTLQIFPLR